MMSHQGKTILIVEDEADLRDLLQFNLERAGYSILSAEDGTKGLKIAQEQSPDLILLDLMMPGLHGIEVCKQLRQADSTSPPIIMLTAMGSEADVVRGLQAGADDYITKPYSQAILLARVEAIFRRTDHSESTKDQIIHYAGITIDSARHEVKVDDKTIDLSASEFRLLKFFTHRPGRVFTREQIISHMHNGDACVTDRSVDVMIASLRRKLGTRGHRIETVRGVGYRCH